MIRGSGCSHGKPGEERGEGAWRRLKSGPCPTPEEGNMVSSYNEERSAVR